MQFVLGYFVGMVITVLVIYFLMSDKNRRGVPRGN